MQHKKADMSPFYLYAMLKPTKRIKKFKKSNKRVEVRQKAELEQEQKREIKRPAFEVGHARFEPLGLQRSHDPLWLRNLKEVTGNVFFLMQPVLGFFVWVAIVGVLLYLTYNWFLRSAFK